MTTKTVIYFQAQLSGGNLTTPADYDDASAVWTAQGPGGNSAASFSGGGGGQLCNVSAPGLSANTAYAAQIDVGGSVNATFLKNGGGTTILSASAGFNGDSSAPNARLGGTGGTGTNKFNGGNGGVASSFGGGGGGGAGGTNGAGANGGNEVNGPGGGGGAGDGGSAGSDGASVNPGGDGGGPGGGTGGNAAVGGNATANTAGGGGGGGWSNFAGGNGASKNTYTDNSGGPNNGVSVGPGGGGGGAGGNSTAKGGDGGYGGGGGAGTVGANSGSKGIGGVGYIVLEYTPAAQSLTVVAGSLTLVGETLSFTNSPATTFTVVAGSLTLAGQTVGASKIFVAASGTLTLAGQTVSYSYGGAFTLVAGSLTLAGQAVPGGLAQKIMRIAPYAPTDTIGTKTYQVYQIVGGVLTAVGSANTAAFQAIPNITNGWWVEFWVIPNGAYGDFNGIALFGNVNGESKAIELYSPPTQTPTSLVITKVAPFLTTDVVATPGYQLYDNTGVAFGSHVTAGILAIPGQTNGYCAQITLTPDSNGGAQYGIEWDGG